MKESFSIICKKCESLNKVKLRVSTSTHRENGGVIDLSFTCSVCGKKAGTLLENISTRKKRKASDFISEYQEMAR